MLLKSNDNASDQVGARGLSWERSYALRVFITDALVLIWVIFGVQIAWLGLDPGNVATGWRPDSLAISYSAVSVVLLLGWLLALYLVGSRGSRVIGSGNQEYRLVAAASFRLFGLVAILAFLLQFDLARGYVLIALPLGLLVLLFSRWMWRQWLAVERQRGRYSHRVLLAGSSESVRHVWGQLRAQPEAGYLVVGACVPSSNQSDATVGLPILGGLDDVSSAIAEIGADTVVITSSDELPAEKVRRISWSLEAGRQHLVVAPSLIDIAGPRIHTRPVAGLPLIHVETPRYEGSKRYAKRAFDVILAATLLTSASPLFLLVGVLVAGSSPGPIFYRQERIGRNGKPFEMLKFRSMRTGSDSQLSELLAAQGTDGKPLFKVRDDPRITRIGRVLRKYSIDELPQLINVLKGEMSLVGPRPQREGEVALYDDAARRRLIVQPGMTGLWQVSGRSALGWEDAIRLDLFYVENWSITADLIILWRTASAVIKPGESAY